MALITLLQFSENLSDRRAADAVRARIDWIYLLGLDLTDPGFDASVLSEFRCRLMAGGAEALLFDTLLTLCREPGVLTKRGRQRIDATQVLGAVRSLNRLDCAIETLRGTLTQQVNDLAGRNHRLDGVPANTASPRDDGDA